MPSASQHLEQAERNESLYKDLCRLYTSVPKYTEWEVVALFYSALHYIEAYFDIMHGGRHSDNHGERGRYIRETDALSAIAPDYMLLYRTSINARYRLQSISMDQVRSIEVNEFAAVKGHVRALLRV